MCVHAWHSGSNDLDAGSPRCRHREVRDKRVERVVIGVLLSTPSVRIYCHKNITILNQRKETEF